MNTSLRRLFLAWCVLWNGMIAVLAMDFEATGTITFTNAFRTAAISGQQSRFVARRYADKWSITLLPSNPAAYETLVVTFDGSTLYGVWNMESLTKRAQQEGHQLAPNIAGGHVVRGSEIYHHILGHEIGPIWLCLLSSHYFQTRTNHYLEPAMTLGVGTGYYDNRKSAFTQFAEWTLLDSEPRLPTAITYYDDDFTLSYDARRPGADMRPWEKLLPFDAQVRLGPTGASQDEDYTQLLKGWPKGNNQAVNQKVGTKWKSAVYSVSAFTTFAASRFPKSAKIQVYNERIRTNGDLLCEYAIHIDKITAVSSFSGTPPPLPGTTDIDVLPAASGSIHLRTTNWPATVSRRE